MEKCQRCNSNDVKFICLQCEKFKKLCEKCDN